MLGGISLGSVTLVELVGIIAHPITWIALLFAVPAAIPLASLPAAGASIVALIAVSFAALLAAHALGNVLSTSRTAHRVSGAFRFIFTVALLGILFSNADFQWPRALSGSSYSSTRYSSSTMRAEGFSASFAPGALRYGFSRGGSFPPSASMIAALGLYILSLRGMYNAAGEAAPPRARRRSETRRGTGMAAVVYLHELRYFARSLGGLVAIAAGIAAGVWLLATREPSMNIALLGGFLALAAGFTYSSNIFGHDGHALRRYALLGPDWGMVFAAKNRAWLTVMGLSVLPSVAIDAARVSLSSALSLLLSAGVVLALSVVWGNISSVLLPSRIGSGQANAFVNQAAPFALCALPFGIHTTVAPFGSFGFDIAVCICLVATAALYAFLLHRISRSFDAEVESILARF